MSTATRTVAEGPFLHEALFYRDPEEFLAGTVPFVHSAIAVDEPVVAAVPAANGELLRRALSPEARHRVEILDMSAEGRNPGRIIPAVLHSFIRRHAGRRVRLVGEPIWPGRSADEYPACVQHEALINVAFADRTATILCPYDASHLQPGVLSDAARTHPILIDHEGRRESGEYASPDTVVAAFNEALPDPTDLTIGPIGFDAATLHVIRRAVGEEGLRAGMHVDRVTDLRLAVNEVATNAVVHTGGPATLRVWRTPEHLICEVRDAGRLTGYLLGRLPPEHHELGGRGLLVVHELCDLVRVHTADEGTSIRLYFSY